jgi:hypothetical protein
MLPSYFLAQDISQSVRRLTAVEFSSFSTGRITEDKTFIYVIWEFKLVYFMHIRIRIVLVRIVLSSCRRFQNGTKNSY